MNFYCCDPAQPCRVHTSTTGGTVYFSTKPFLKQLKIRAKAEGISVKDLLAKAIEAYLATPPADAEATAARR
jgi:hypothetical protein